METIQRIKEAHKGEWLAIAVVQEGHGEVKEGELVYHSEDRDEVWKRIAGEPRRIYVTYAGPMLEEGYAAAF